MYPHYTEASSYSFSSVLSIILSILSIILYLFYPLAYKKRRGCRCRCSVEAFFALTLDFFKKKKQVLLRWSAERGIPFVASPSTSSSASEIAAVPDWALSPASRDALDGADAAAGSAKGLRTLAPKAGAGFVWPGAAEGGAGKASEVLLPKQQQQQ